MKPLNLIALLLFLGGAVWALTRSERTVREIQRGYYSAIQPFLKSGSAIETHSRDFLKEVRHSKDLETELTTIRSEIGRLPIIEARCGELERENAQLRHALEFKQATNFRVVAAQIIRRQPATWWQTVEIDAGMKRGIGPQLAVLSHVDRHPCLVGIIDRSSDDRSSVVLLTDEACQVSAKVEESPEVGILTGQRGLGEGTPLLRLKFLSKNAVLQAGQRVFTTGRGGIFRANILLGEIVSVEKGAEDSEALVRPAVNFGDLGTVFVVIDKSDPPQ
ncbi:MAG: rod shape-determining protein MreC [Verrucomicrobia bacterium]|nr:rod shape-determining protein MreC [Verrucomicrobiota bacterium]